ncbi:MAG: hypothetical protein E6K56_02350 [Ignavibacteria bacterium]|nr:MAG: hypothetical protein E6K56_02350 [Ignavibacteria bacterium]
MQKMTARLSLLSVILLALPISGSAQKVHVGGRFGLSFFGYGGQSSAGLQIGPTFDYEFQPRMFVGSDLNINTQGGTPVELAPFFRYFLEMPKTEARAYLDGGFNLWFVTGGTYFGLRFGGGAYFPVAPHIEIPADLQLGPVFTTGSSTFYLAITSGIRYTLP